MDSRHSTVAANTLLSLAYRSREQELNKDFPRVLILLTGNFIGMEEGFTAIRQLERSRMRLKLAADEQLLQNYTAQQLAEKTGIDDIATSAALRSLAPEAADLLFIPVLSLPLLSRLCMLDAGDPYVELIIRFICAGRPAGTLTLGANPGHYRWGEQGLLHAPPGLQAALKHKLDAIEDFGITLLEPDQVNHWITSAQSRLHKQVLTAEDIQDAVSLGRTSIRPSVQAVITPLAADLARQHGIEIIL
ncbi:hypothetical protein R70723_28170 [Paenibacillus sp. FSL R7-0273]|uniref:hypothetical protein n=1 Tax=Paenibacillus sp. FSL R7-0273 TaxID=1536772 RepID=UPI0004F64BBA|nr:hypothetical protein [Paenibacillus sp. FSL R7-0273]AIQ49340.1 hypothetical protein R70723_28170 [Paenibacillus sp. FSL R7-0273]OMF87986.1 hypothetical protein BK144_22505 [Paenibacillus sp. FSL R7-0273]